MNLVELHKGEGMYVGADGLHAWLTGGTCPSRILSRISNSYQILLA